MTQLCYQCDHIQRNLHPIAKKLVHPCSLTFCQKLENDIN